MKANLYNLKGELVKEVTLPKDIFEAKINDTLISQAIRVYQNNQRKAHAVVKHRGEIAGTTKKMYAQKGTGNARHSTAKAPQFVGGGSAHGPRGNQFPKMKMSQRLRQSALNSLLSKFAKNKAIILVDKISTIEPKTKTALNFISKLEKDNQSLASAKKFAIITSRSHKSVKRAFGNLKRVNLLSVKSLNSYLLANNKYLILTEASVKKLRK
ncbi:50S ribosomal protein L4 [Candidatus Shapirobacteria bacterium]|nr:50S ribosomal protein L4 [Candidatus Shapirobacteria bacterium]HQI13287.1 50S ribosomal protein L4 [Candidatus Woesebacteria bacterium]